ncbi:ATP-binding protein [Paractinoplanes brasiliensis]|uniref:Anti-sigma regulatory factor (Ser/Thr protein kinase) n=1 Tax=Paractinoplanes brasiliensis TaxID=52695 RepID=A0A4R6JNF9_9ACTN|nr:ATP-binding protein [Actinoplanes brasiliensis]TDO36921.1 anti-sigma regulatory factor (Ser/Thr protein kinase) [Actinoplanes brasiliensis]GID30442.1 hypothetical protein Abr02nite_54250 [Actinoplanes brasiliensis]
MTGPEQETRAVEPAAILDLTQPFTENELYTLRAAVTAHAHAGGVSSAAVDILLIVIGELASNAVRHGGGSGTLRFWHADGLLHCQIRDEGPGIADPELAGREPVPPTATGGRGLWIVRQLCQEVSVESDAAGTIVTATLAP